MEYAIVTILGLVAGFLIPLAAGSGLFSLAGLIILGLPPQVAIATNRMGGIGLWPPVIYKYHKAGLIVWKYVLPLSAISIIGSTIGAHIVLAIPEEILKPIVAALLLAVLVVTTRHKGMGIANIKPDKTKEAYGYLGCFGASIYAGFFGSGQGIFVDFLQMKFFGLTMLQSKATAAIPTYLFIISSLSVFLLSNIVNVAFGSILAISMGIGGWWGAQLAIIKGNEWLKRIFILVTGIMGAALLYQSF